MVSIRYAKLSMLRPFGMRARDVERLHAADGAEIVPCGPGVEGVGRKLCFALYQLEPRFRNDQVKEAHLGADRAVAIRHFEAFRRRDLEPNPPAMASASVCDQLIPPRSWPRWLYHASK